MTVLLALTAAALFGIGTYLVLQRKLSRIIIGVALLGHGANVLMVSSGRPGNAADRRQRRRRRPGRPARPRHWPSPPSSSASATTALLLALAYRSWLLTDDDEVQDDVEDDLIARRGAPDDELAGSATRPTRTSRAADDRPDAAGRGSGAR